MFDEIVKNWDTILITLKDAYGVADVSFKTFLLPLAPYAINGNTLYILHQNETNHYSLNFLKNKYSLSFKETISTYLNEEYEIEFILPADTSSLDFNNPPSQMSSQSRILENDQSYRDSHLNPKFTFDTFVVGEYNRFAQNASLAVAESPGESYNPLYIYGGPGLGKTHLMHSIGNFILSQTPNKRILYVTSEEFVNEVIESIKRSNSSDSMQRLREKYRSVDVLMIDDIQFIIGKESTQNEFFHTFNTLHASEKQIILSSDRPPREMETLESRIRSRFEMGLMADLGSPDYETRMAILRKKLESLTVPLSDDILSYIAENITSNVREIEGALNKLVAYYNLEKTDITMEIAKQELDNIISPSSKNKEITPQLIIEVVADHYNISVEQMCSLKKNREISWPRQVAMYLCREMTDYAFNSIGNLLGGKDHSTVIHGVRKVENEYKDDSTFHTEIEDIKQKIIMR